MPFDDSHVSVVLPKPREIRHPRQQQQQPQTGRMQPCGKVESLRAQNRIGEENHRKKGGAVAGEGKKKERAFMMMCCHFTKRGYVCSTTGGFSWMRYPSNSPCEGGLVSCYGVAKPHGECAGGMKRIPMITRICPAGRGRCSREDQLPRGCIPKYMTHGCTSIPSRRIGCPRGRRWSLARAAGCRRRAPL